MNSKGCRLISLAIVEKAVKDYLCCPSKRREVENFFRSNWFDIINPLPCSGELVIEKLRKQADIGYWCDRSKTVAKK